jgi:hypothetical protein
MNNDGLDISGVKMVLRITKNSDTTKQLILLRVFQTAFFGLKGHHKVAHSDKRKPISNLYVTEFLKHQNLYHYFGINNMEE